MDDPIIEKTLRGHKDAITSISFNPSTKLSHRKEVTQNEQLASSSLDGSLTLWTFSRCLSDCCSKKGSNPVSHKCPCKNIRAFRFAGHTGPINYVSYSPTGQLLASCSSDTTVRLWTPTVNGKSITLKGHNAPVRGMDFSKSESLMVTCSDDKTLKIWSLPHCTFQASLLGHTRWVRACRFSQDPNLCASGSDDGTVRLWDIEQGENIVTYTSERIGDIPSKMLSQPGFVGVEFHPSNYILGTTSTDGYVRLYDLRRDKVIHTFSVSGLPSKEASANYGPGGICFDPSGNSLLVSSRDHHQCEMNLFSLWDMRTQRISHSFSHKENNKPRECTVPLPVSFSTDGSRFSSGCSDGAVLIWKFPNDVSSNKAITKPAITDAVKHNMRRSDDKQLTRKNPTSNELSLNEFIVDGMNTDWMTHLNELSSSERKPDEPSKQEEKADHQVENKSQTSEPALQLTRTLEHIVAQLSLITQTMELIERRVTMLEDTLSKM